MEGEAMGGPFIYAKVDDLEGQAKVSNKSCASLVQWYTKAPGDAKETWREGIKVRGNEGKIKKGTAVATFVNGRYPRTLHNKHAALYIEQDASGIWVMDQWEDDTSKPTISKRRMAFKGTHPNSTSYIDPSNNGDALSVIMSEL
jgi:hypothetical protein